MPDMLRATAMSPHLVDQAWPVAQHLYAGLTLDQWRRAVSHPDSVRCSCPDAEPVPLRTLMAVCDRGYIYGIARYAVGECERDGVALMVDAAVAVSLVGSRRPAEVLFDGLTAEAEAAGCDVVRIRIPGTRTWVVGGLAPERREAALASFMNCTAVAL